MLDTWWSAFRTSPTELLKSADEVFQVPAMATKMSLQVDEYVVEGPGVLDLVIILILLFLG